VSDFDFEKEMLELSVNIGSLSEMRIAYRQAPLGFELVVARAKGANNSGAALVTHIRNGAHLKAEGDHAAAEQQAKMFVCKFCGPLGGTTTDNHYNNFPWHKDGQPGPPLTYAKVEPVTPKGLVRSEADINSEEAA
jgi:hypothetical protein